MAPARFARIVRFRPIPPVVRNVVGVLFVVAGSALSVWTLVDAPANVWDGVPISLAGGALIGLGYQTAPFLQRSPERSPDKRWYLTALVICMTALVGTVVAVAFHSSVALGILAVCMAAFAVYLSERFPSGGKWPGVFLISAVLDAAMVVQMSWADSGQHIVVGLALFLPAFVVAILLTVWAFMVRTLGAAEYAKATEVARGVLFAWLLLITASTAWISSGFSLGGSDSLDPLKFAVPLVTFGSVIATVTTGWTRFREARAVMDAMTTKSEDHGLPAAV